MDKKQAIKKLEQIRRKKHLSTEKFAKQELDISRQTYSNWINGHWNPSYENMQKIEDFLED